MEPLTDPMTTLVVGFRLGPSRYMDVEFKLVDPQMPEKGKTFNSITARGDWAGIDNTALKDHIATWAKQYAEKSQNFGNSTT